MKKLLAVLAISATLIAPASAADCRELCLAAGRCGDCAYGPGGCPGGMAHIDRCYAACFACRAAHRGGSVGGTAPHVPEKAAKVPAPVQSRPGKAAKVTAPAQKPKDTCNGTLTSNGCVPTPAPSPPPPVNVQVGPPPSNQAAPASPSPVPGQTSGGYNHPQSDCSTITGPGMSGGGPPNCGPTGNGIGAQPGQSGPTNKQTQTPDSARQQTPGQWTPGALPLPTTSDGTPYDPTDIVDPSNPQLKERCLVALQRMAPRSSSPDWLKGEMARSHCNSDGTPMSKRDQLKYELQKQDE
jgi:hypothetical protein